MAEAKIVKLITGEEILCTIAHTDGDFTGLKHPISIFRGEEDNLSFNAYMPFAEIDVLDVNTNTIVFTTTPTEKLGEAYFQMTSQVVIPPEKKIVT